MTLVRTFRNTLLSSIAVGAVPLRALLLLMLLLELVGEVLGELLAPAIHMAMGEMLP